MKNPVPFPGDPAHRDLFPDMSGEEYLTHFRCECGRGWLAPLEDECFECCRIRADYPGCELIGGMRVIEGLELPTPIPPDCLLCVHNFGGEWVIVGLRRINTAEQGGVSMPLIKMDPDGIIRDLDPILTSGDGTCGDPQTGDQGPCAGSPGLQN